MSSPPQTLPTPRRTNWRRPAWGAAVLALAAAIAVLAVSLAGGGARPAAGHHTRLIIGAATTHPAAAHNAPRPAATTHANQTRLIAEAPDPLANQSYPDPAGAATHPRAAAPSIAGASASPGAPSLSQVQRQLAQMHEVQKALGERHSGPGYIDPVSGAFSPSNVVPLKIAQVIAGGNAIADFPYVYGGGHASFVDRAYDCSGSVSYALAAAGLIGAPETSGQLETWGKPGPGKWLTVFANAGHTFMIVDGVWFDTAGRAGPYSTRWLRPPPSLAGYVVRHYPGL